MPDTKLTRRQVNVAIAAAGGVTLFSRRSRAADITLIHNHNLPVESPLHKRATEMWAAVKAETNGRVEVQIARGDAGLDKLVGGDLAFMTLAGNGLASLVPAADVQATPYGFRNPAQVYAALDGELGAYLRDELRAKGIYAVPGGCFENGMHQITSNSRPIRSAADFQGLKIRIPGTPVYQSFFKSMGAQIVTLNLTKLYDGLKSGMAEAQDDPWDVVELFKLYEFQKYASVTEHSWSGYNLLASQKVWQGLPADVQRVIETNTRKFVALQRADTDALNNALRADLTKRGMTFNEVDKASFRPALTAFYPRWKDHIGSRTWDLLEAHVGRLG
ncbi:MAG TPA: TRAP transporter substrate-binding protein [Micropepsaceae bacterium]|jgi:tripartite ATP-independent transporter DctP family solute receptor|nr:TRAP transporter substrate-binding protein [Micropepsaceae bacterium]